MTTTSERQKQKKKSRIKNNITTMQLSNTLKLRIKRIQKYYKYDKQDEALDEVLTEYEDRYPEIRLLELDDE